VQRIQEYDEKVPNDAVQEGKMILQARGSAEIQTPAWHATLSCNKESTK
jgi:hypothetical protein